MALQVHEPVPLRLPPPGEGFERHGAWVRGPWRLWVDARAIDPRRHVVSFERRVWRACEGEPPVLLHEAPRVRVPARALLGEAGDALLQDGPGVVHHPAAGAPRRLEVPGAAWCLPLAAFHDGAVLRAGGDGRRARLVFAGFDGRTRELEEGEPDRLDHADPVRGGRWLCWLAHGRERLRAVRVLDLEGSDGPRDLQVAHHHLALDGVAGRWLLAREGTTVRLLPLEGGPEHAFHAPHEVVAVHPRRVLCRLPGRPGSGQQLLVWDPLRPAERRRVWLPPGEHAWQGDEPPARVEPDRFVVTGARGYEPIPLDPPDAPAPGALRALVGPTLDALRSHRASLLAAKDAPGACPEAWLALLSAGHGCWLLDERDVALHEELAGAAPDPNVAGLAIRRLGVHGGEAARAALLRVLARTTDHGRQRDLFEALASAGVAADAAALQAADPVPGITDAAARALGLLGDPAAAPWLEARRRLRFPLREQTDEIRAAVDEALARLRDRPAALAAWAGLPGGAP